jgi:Ca2+/Na+ antiporter
MNALMFIADLAILVRGANLLVRGASKFALSFGISPLVVVPSLLTFDLWVMIAVAFACLPIFVTGREIARCSYSASPHC